MGDEYMHTVYKNAHRETTQWDDAQRKLGNLPPLPPEPVAEKYAPEAEETTANKVDRAQTVDELEELEDDVGDDRELAELRRRRLDELKAGPKKPRFGTVELIGRSDFVREVTEVFVVVHMFKDSVSDCEVMSRCLTELARKYPSSKFVRIISTDAVPEYPDSNLPTVIVYRDKDVAKSFVGLRVFGGHRATPENVAMVLNTAGRVCVSDGDEDDAENSRLAMEHLKRILEKVSSKNNGRGTGDDDSSEDESSDFDD